MKYIFAASLLLLIALSGLAWMLKPKSVQDGKTVLLYLTDDNDLRKEQVALFNKLYPQFQLRIDPGATDLTKVVVQCLGGVGPDFFLAYNGLELSNYVNAGIAWDITDELPKLGINMETDVWKAADSCLKYNGRYYGFPKNVCTEAVWFNKDMLDKQGLPYPTGPWTWDEFLKVAQKLTLRDKKGRITQYGFLFNWPAGEGGAWMHFIRMWGGQVYTPDGTRCTLDSPECIAAVQCMQDLIYRYQVMPSPAQEDSMSAAGGWGAGSITWFAGGRAAMALGGNYWQIVLKDYKNLRLGVVESPHGPQRQYRGYGSAVIINKNSPHRQEALQFVKFMAGQPYNELISRQSDGLGPIKKFSYTDQYLHSSKQLPPAEQAIWRDVMQFGVPDQESQFINGMSAAIILYEQLDLVKNNTKSAAAAMRDATKRINAEIQKTLKRDPALRARYDQLISGRK